MTGKAVKKPRKGGSWAAANALIRSWFLTINAHEEDSVPTISADQISSAFREIDPNSDFVFQLERGESGGDQGYLHYQGCLLLSREKPRRRRDVVAVLKKNGILDAHLEKVKRIGAAEAYCSKSKTRQAGPWWSSENFHDSSVRKAAANGSGAVGDRMILADAVDDGMDPDSIALDPTLRLLLTPSNKSFVETIWAAKQGEKWSHQDRDVVVTFIWGPTGVGKTRSVREQIPADDLYSADLGTRDPFGLYRFQPCLLLDEFRDSIPISQLLQLLDRYPYQIDRRYSNLWAAWSRVFICSNWSPAALYRDSPESDRAALRRRITTITHMTGKED